MVKKSDALFARKQSSWGDVVWFFSLAAGFQYSTGMAYFNTKQQKKAISYLEDFSSEG